MVITSSNAGSTLARIALCVLALPLAVSSAGSPPADLRNNLVYEIFVRSFADTNGDGIGDLRGVTSRLDTYLNDGRAETNTDLEVGVLWLMPIFPSPSYHGYDVSDYESINPEYGTLADFDALIAAAHRRGVRVVLDLPLNHTSSEHPWFRKALADPRAAERRYYHIRRDEGPAERGWHVASTPAGDRVRYFGLFDPSMPDLDFDTPAVRDLAKGIADFWLARGVDGFRLDAAKHVYGDTFGAITDDQVRRDNEWWREFSEAVYRRRPDAVLMGEVLGNRRDVLRYVSGLDGLLDETFMSDVRAQIVSPGSGLVERYQQFAAGVHAAFSFVASHDRDPRLASALDDAKAQGKVANVDRAYRLAMYMLLTIPNHPVVYMGDEVMQRGRKWPDDGSGVFDRPLREPFPWFRSNDGPGQTRWFEPRFDRPGDGVSREEEDRPGGMLDLVRALSHLRARHPAFANGDIGAILSDTPEWLVFERGTDSERYLVLINQTAEARAYEFHTGWYPAWIGATLLFRSDGASRRWIEIRADGERIGRTVRVPACGLVVLRRAP